MEVYVLYAPPVICNNSSAITYAGDSSQWAMKQSHCVMEMELICSNIMNMVMQQL